MYGGKDDNVFNEFEQLWQTGQIKLIFLTDIKPMAEFLIKKGANVTMHTSVGATCPECSALHIAAVRSN